MRLGSMKTVHPRAPSSGIRAHLLQTPPAPALLSGARAERRECRRWRGRADGAAEATLLDLNSEVWPKVGSANQLPSRRPQAVLRPSDDPIKKSKCACPPRDPLAGVAPS